MLAKERQSLLLIASVVGAFYLLRFGVYLFVVNRVLSIGWREILKMMFCQAVFALTCIYVCPYCHPIIAWLLPSFVLLSIQIASGGISFVTLILFSPFADIRCVLFKVMKNYEPQLNSSVLYRALMRRLHRDGRQSNR